MKKSNATKIAAVLLLGLVLAGGLVFSNIYTNYIELKEIGSVFVKAFWTDLTVQMVTFLISFLLYFVVIFLNFMILRGNLNSIDSSLGFGRKTFPVLAISIVASALLGSLTTSALSSQFLPFLNSEWFSMGDDIFHQDIGYYIFQRPFYVSALRAALMLFGWLTVATAVVYTIAYARFDFYNLKQLLKERAVILHIIVEIILYFLVKAVSYRFVQESILYNEGKKFFGAGYVDNHVWLTYYKIAPILLMGVVALTIMFVLRRRYKEAILMVVAYPASFLIVGLVATVVQGIVVAPNEMAAELPYYQSNINATRAAYNLLDVQQQDYPIQYDLNGAKMLENLSTINNIRLIDANQTLKVANQLQGIKNYYQFKDTDIMMYELDGVKTAVFVAAREINNEKLDESAKNYINTKMKYTHGIGVVMNPVNRLTEQGQPYFVIRDIPPRSINGAPVISQPRIYFGENGSDYSIVGTKDKELDEIDPTGFSYDGNAGIKLNLFHRLIYSVKYADFKILFSDQITADSKLLVNQNILQRVQKMLPFLTIDQDPIIVIDNEGKLKWMVDGYSTSNAFPYAQAYGDYNYIRNAVKVVVDAYDGSVKCYIIDQKDPIIKCYARIYPSLFASEPLPADLAQRMRYPEYLFKLQSEVLRKYHITDANDFYQKKGMWAVAKEKYEADKNPREVEPYYTLMKMNGGEELMLMLPYTLVDKDNLVAWLAVSSNPGNYGKLTAYRFPGTQNIYGTYQIENRIDIDPEISQDITLWSRGGSTVVRGNMMVIPIAGNLLYVEPIYLSSGGGETALPEVKRIVVAYGDKVVSRSTLDEALAVLFGVKRPELPTGEEALNQVIQQVVQSFQTVQQAAKSTNWEQYGTAMKTLEESINALRDQAGTESIPAQTPPPGGTEPPVATTAP